MAISLKHDFVSAVPDGADASIVRPSDWNAEHEMTMATARLLGRTTASAGAVEEITVGSGLSLAAGALTATGGAASGWTMVSQGTVSAVSQVDFALVTASYSEFMIHFVGTCTDITQIRCRVSQASTFLSGAADYAWAFDEIVYGDVPDNTSDFIQVTASGSAGGSGAIRIHLINPGSTTVQKFVRFDGTMVQDGPLLSIVQGAGIFYANNNAIDGFRLYPSFGGTLTGSYKMLGIPV